MLNSLYDKYNGKGVNFLSIYTSEAHADDIWPIRTKKELRIKQHQTIDDRIKSALLLQEFTGWKIPIYADTMDNKFETRFNTWPLRIFIVDSNQIFKWIMMFDKDASVDLNEIGKQIDNLVTNKEYK